MKLSIFTPTHLPQHLVEAYDSIRRQNYQDWEWVLVPNGPKAFIPDQIRKDSRVKVVSGGERLYNIGAIKRLACDNCSGDAFVELDHDDLLVPANSLTAIARAFEKGAGFVFSDPAVFTYGGEKPPYGRFAYSPSHGWENYSVTVYGRELLASKAFEPSPRSLCEIYYAPDHVRCWSREAYYSAGGHNRELSVIDDHELMVKTYLAGFPFRHTGGCHYLYRYYPQNTVKGRGGQIKDLTRKFKVQYTKDLIYEWASRENYETLDLTKEVCAGGSNRIETVKKLLSEASDLFRSGQYGVIQAENLLQWLPGDLVADLVSACYRALKPGGYLVLCVPDARTDIGFADPGYRSYYSKASMLPFVSKHYAADNGRVAARFQEVLTTDEFPSDWHKKMEFRYLRFHLCALKGQRQPGATSI
jgi:O-antigen biosynthesis protein